MSFLTLSPDPEDMLEKADAALIVGDPALNFNGDCAEIYDLGA